MKDEVTARDRFRVPSAVKKPAGRRRALRAFNAMAAKAREGRPKLERIHEVLSVAIHRSLFLSQYPTLGRTRHVVTALSAR
jgi:hypothetical protein